MKAMTIFILSCLLFKFKLLSHKAVKFTKIEAADKLYYSRFNSHSLILLFRNGLLSFRGQK